MAEEGDVPNMQTPVSDELKSLAESKKEKANDQFKNQHFNEAIDLYSEAITANPNVAAYYGNRSFAYVKTECYGYALTDANRALELDQTYVKAYYRRASANMALGKFKLALKDFDAVMKARPSDKDARAKYNECNKIVKRVAFEKAIAVDDQTSCVAEQISLDSMTIEDLYKGPSLEDGKVTLSFVKHLMDEYKKQGQLHKKYAYKILLDVREVFQQLPSLVDITVPEGKKFTVCGDIHGQYYDLLNIFQLNGLPSEENPYPARKLDYVIAAASDENLVRFRKNSHQLLYPTHFYMSRGNHESVTMNQMYGFDGEVKAKYTPQMSELFTEVYNFLPLAHCINNKIMVMHGGLFSEDSVTLDDIRQVERNRQPPDSGIMCELLWSDPQPQCGRSASKRGVGIQFGPDVTKRFLQKNGLDYVIRSHEVKSDGYEVAHDGKCITVFSAPNYCDTMGNKGAFITLTGGDLKPEFTSYSAVPHPDVKPMAYANSLLSLLS